MTLRIQTETSSCHHCVAEPMYFSLYVSECEVYSPIPGVDTACINTTPNPRCILCLTSGTIFYRVIYILGALLTLYCRPAFSYRKLILCLLQNSILSDVPWVCIRANKANTGSRSCASTINTALYNSLIGY